MPRSITGRRRGKYNCKLYERAHAAEVRARVIINAHDKCIDEREWRITQLTSRLRSMNKILAAAIIAAGGEVCVDFKQANEYGERDISVTQKDGEVFTYKYIGKADISR